MGHFEKCKYAESCGYEFCPCEECIDFEAKVMTNADRIRGMSDELLASQLVQVFHDGVIALTGVELPREILDEFRSHILDKLQQPAEVE